MFLRDYLESNPIILFMVSVEILIILSLLVVALQEDKGL